MKFTPTIGATAAPSRHNRRLRATLIAALISAPIIALPQIARAADHTPDSHYSNTYNIPSENDPNVVAGENFDVVVESPFTGPALQIQGKGSITYDGTYENNTLVGGSGGISITNTGDIASGNIGSITINTVADVTATNGTGISASNLSGTGGISITAANVTATSTGINAVLNSTSATGDITINAQSVTGSDGIKVTNNGTGVTNITTTGDVSGNGTETNYGIFVQNKSTSTGDTTITTSNVTGAKAGISARLAGTGAITINSTGGTVIGNNGAGIDAFNNTGGNNASANADTTITTADVISHGVENAAIFAWTNGSGNVTVNSSAGDVIADGNSSNGIFAARQDTAGTGDSGDVSIISKNVSGTDYGIFAQNLGVGDTIVKSTGTVIGATEAGISVNHWNSGAGDVIVEANNVTGGTNGIATWNDGSGETSITTTGTIIGDINGISAWNDGTGKTGVTINGEVAGVDAGVQLTFTNTHDASSITINEDGIVHNIFDDSASGAIIISNGTADQSTTINNSGTITGTIQAVDGQGIAHNLTLNNSGTWNVTGINNFGPGTNSISNDTDGVINAFESGAPVITLAAITTPSTSTTTFSGVGQFINSGTISLQNDVAGDTLTITNGGTGVFTTNGGSLFLDADLNTYDADLLIVDNLTVANSPTKIYVHNTSDTVIGGIDSLIQLVQVNGSSVDNAFALGAVVTDGLYEYETELTSVYDPDSASYGTNGYYLMIGDAITPENAEVRGEAISTNLLSVLSGRTALTALPGVHDRNNYDSDGKVLLGVNNNSRNTWARTFQPAGVLYANRGGDAIAQSRNANAGIFGQSEKFRTDDGNGYNATTTGIQVGTDIFANQNGNGSTKGGIYAAYADSNGTAYQHDTRIGNLDVNTTSVGAYLTKFSTRGWYVDAVAQYSHLSGAQAETDLNVMRPSGNSLTLSLEAGQRFARKSKYIPEVQAQLIHQRTSLDEITLTDSTVLSPQHLNSTTARLGVRLEQNSTATAKFKPWLAANLWHTFGANAKVDSGGDSYATPISGTSLGLQAGFVSGNPNSNKWTLQGSAGYLFNLSGARYSGWRGTLGVRRGW